MSDKPLFIPLCAEPYEAFESGTKRHELRPYGPRWTEKTCIVGRAVTLSKGYGKQNRLQGVIRSFRHTSAQNLPKDYREAVERHYDTYDIEIAVVGIDILPKTGCSATPEAETQTTNTMPNFNDGHSN